VKTVEDAKGAALELLDRGCGCVVVTMGEQGSVFVNASRNPVYIPAKKVNQVDSTV
jgi:fructose-1-phosphate kinase PfkB-like protein